MNDINQLINAIVEGIREKKGRDIVSLNFTKIENSICKYFVICDADSNTQVDAIANSVEDIVKKKTDEKVWNKDGFKNSEWVLLDYADVVVHIFQKSFRKLYNLEGLWADAEKLDIK